MTHETSTLPVAVDSAPYFMAFVASSCNAMDSDRPAFGLR